MTFFLFVLSKFSFPSSFEEGCLRSRRGGPVHRPPPRAFGAPLLLEGGGEASRSRRGGPVRRPPPRAFGAPLLLEGGGEASGTDRSIHTAAAPPTISEISFVIPAWRFLL